MNVEYCVWFEGKAVGTVQLKKSGLYYRISCCCQEVSASMYNLFVSTGKIHRKLGICIPKNGHLCLDTSVPIKVFGEEELQFYLQRRSPEVSEVFIPVVQGEKFPLLEELENAYMTEQDGIIGIAFKSSRKDSTQAQQDNGQIP